MKVMKNIPRLVFVIPVSYNYLILFKDQKKFCLRP